MKEKFVKQAIILMVGGLITKVLSLIIRIITTRIIGLEGIGLYTMIMPTFNLFITIATLSLPVAISKVVAEDKRNNKKLILGIIPVALFFNLLIILVIVIISPFIANTLLKNNNFYFPLIATSITLPFITLSSIIRGYFFGREKMLPHVLSNIAEQVIRIIIIILITPTLLNKGIYYTISGLILFNCISEFISILVFLIFIPKQTMINKNYFKPNINYIKDIFNISIPTTMGRLISSIGMFLEPIIITYIFLKIGWTSFNITTEYGIINGYVIPMVTIPSFFTGAISSALLPALSKYHSEKNKTQLKRKLYQGIFYSSLIGIICTIILILFPKFFLLNIFHTIHGVNYLKISSIIFLFSYVLSPLSSFLQAINKSKTLMFSNLICVILKTLTLFIFSFFNIKMYSILISYLIQFIFSLIHQIIIVKKELD